MASSVEFWEKRASSDVLGDDEAAGVTTGVFSVELPARMVDSSMVVVDAGCGFGRYAVPLSHRCRQVIAIDSAVSMLRRLQRRARSDPEGRSNLDVVRASITHMPLRDCSADLLICIGTMYYLSRRWRQMAQKEFNRVSAASFVQYRNILSKYNLIGEISRVRWLVISAIVRRVRPGRRRSGFGENLRDQRNFLSAPDTITTSPLFWMLKYRKHVPVVFIVIDGGPARVERITKIATSLKKCGVDVRIVYPKGTEALTDYETISLSSLHLPYLSKLSFYLHLFLFLVRSKPTLVHFVNYPDYAIVAICLAKYLGRFKVVYDRRSHWTGILTHTHPRSRWLGSIIERIAEQFSDGISVVVPAFKEDLSKCARKVVVVPNGVDLEAFKPEPESSSIPTVTCVAALTESEGARVFIEAASIVKSRLGQVDFVWVGSGSGDAIYKALSSELGAGVRFTGWVQHRDVSKYINRSDVCVSAVLPWRSADVAFPVKLFEYAACAKPVIVSNTSGHLQLIADGVNGLVYESSSPSDLAGKVITLLRDPTLRKRFAEKGRKLAERYSWDNCFRELLSLYRIAGVKISEPPHAVNEAAARIS